MTDLFFLTVKHDNLKKILCHLHGFFQMCTSRSVSNNPDMITNITYFDEDYCIWLNTNGGLAMFDKNINLKVFPLKVHFKKQTMAVIISLSDVFNIDGIRVIFYSHLGIHFDVILPSRPIYRFKQVITNLFIMILQPIHLSYTRF